MYKDHYMNAENHSTLDATAIVSFYTEMSKNHLIFLEVVPSKCPYLDLSFK